jgi:hypothetical protein
MNLLCLGDVGISTEDSQGNVWGPPVGITPDEDTRILFNWELPIGDSYNSKPRTSGPRIVTGLKAINVVQEWAPGFITLANNHIVDAGNSGVIDTIDSLERYRFKTVGAGRTKLEIEQPLIWETIHGRLAILNWVFPETHPDWEHVPGPNCWPGVNVAIQKISYLKKENDWAGAVLHWSDEHFSFPRPIDRVIADKLAHSGLDFIISHHSHVVRGTESIGSCKIFYGLGNFYFSDFLSGDSEWRIRQAPRNLESLGILIKLEAGKNPVYQVYSFLQLNKQVILDPRNRAKRNFEAVSRPLMNMNIDDYSAWYGVQRARFNRWGAKWHFGIRRKGIFRWS